jgi:hypothetical protein
MRKFRKNPYSKIPDLMARRVEKYFGHQRGWIDETHTGIDIQSLADEDLQALMVLYAKLNPANRKKLLAMGNLLLD